jgi:hypothetical protein
MTKKIEISPYLAGRQITESYYRLRGDPLVTTGPSKVYLMSGTVPFNANGMVPWGYNVVIEPVDGGLPTDPVTNPPRTITPGTYTGSHSWFGLGVTASITLTVAENNQIDLQVDSTGELILTSGLASTFLRTSIPLYDVDWDTAGAAQEPFHITAELYDPANLLVTWNNKRLTIYTAPDYDISTKAAPATASGMATWFFIKNSGVMIAGTVGATGSGADLELDDVNIVQGKTYGISNLRIQMPTTSFTY